MKADRWLSVSVRGKRNWVVDMLLWQPLSISCSWVRVMVAVWVVDSSTTEYHKVLLLLKSHGQCSMAAEIFGCLRLFPPTRIATIIALSCYHYAVLACFHTSPAVRLVLTYWKVDVRLFIVHNSLLPSSSSRSSHNHNFDYFAAIICVFLYYQPWDLLIIER